MISLWEDTTQMPSFPKLDQDIKTDVLIIGGGMAGVLYAYMLNAAGVDYVLAEAESVGMGITKNTTAKITAQHGLIYKKLIKEFGIQKAKQYLDLNLRAVETFRTLCEDTDCGFENRNAYVYSVSSREEIVEEINALKQLGYSADFISNTPLPLPERFAKKIRRSFHLLNLFQNYLRGLLFMNILRSRS